jgi:GTP-binding protein Era
MKIQLIAFVTMLVITTRERLYLLVGVIVASLGFFGAKGGLFSFMLEEAKDTAADVDVLAFLVEADSRGKGVAPADITALKALEGKISGKPALLIINKIDVLRDKVDLLPLLQAWATTHAFTALIPVSAHKKDGLKELIAEIRKHLPEAPFLLPKDSITDQSERDIAAELIREKVMLELQQEIPYRAAVVVELFDETRREDERKPLVHIAANIVVEKDSQKAMVIGKGGQRIKAIGQRARAELEHLLDCQVHLELFAKVEPGWTETAQGLRKLGYVRTD